MTMAHKELFLVPQPADAMDTQTFFGLVSLQSGAELITLALLFNKVTGVYGLLAILTGYSLSALQLSLYLYSLIVLVLLAFLIPHIRKQSALENLALAWLYLLDTMVNGAYTAAFAASWYLKSQAEAAAEDAARAGISQPSERQGADGIPTPGLEAGNATMSDADIALNKALGAQDTAMSMVLIIAFTLVRFYFSLVVGAYARQVIHRFVDSQTGWGEPDDLKSGLAARPEEVGSAMGEGWRRRLGTLMLRMASEYWLGAKGDDEWTKDASAKFGRGQRLQHNGHARTTRRS
jgi:inositol phosphorylceramide synthase regulatory subunit